MKESARTGISYIRSVSRDYQIADDFFEKHDIHVHIPEGAVPKDGPSAGITMQLQCFCDHRTKGACRYCHDRRSDSARTCTADRRIKGKASGCEKCRDKTVLVPKKNLADVEELSQEITKGLEILPVEHMEEVLKAAFVSEDQDKISGGE